MTEWDKFKQLLDYAKTHFDNMETWTDSEKLQECATAIEKEIHVLREKKLIE